VVLPDHVGPVKIVIPVFFSKPDFNVSYVFHTKPIFSKLDIHLVGSKNLITVLSDSIPGIKFILASTFLCSHFLLVASNENLQSCGI